MAGSVLVQQGQADLVGPAAGSVPVPRRLHHLDYLRAGLVALVLVHHTAITYGASGQWYYSDPGSSPLLRAILTVFVAFNQAYFMGLLFFISGYLSLPSLLRKGGGRYVADRLRRFGIPLLVYLFGISPVVVWLGLAAHAGAHASLLAFWRTHYLSLRTFDAGPLWFIEALLVMDLLFVLVARRLRPRDLAARPGRPFPNGWALAGFATGLGLASFLARLAMPVGTAFLSLQLGYFPGYVAMFLLGFAAWRGRWLDAIPGAALRWGRRALLIAGGGMLAIEAATHGLSSPSAELAANGGWNWHALLYAMWEPWILVGMSLILLGWGQRRLNRPSRFWQGWTGASYLTYIIQPLTLVPAAILLQDTAWPALAKFGAVAAGCVVLTYALARALRTIPFVRGALG